MGFSTDAIHAGNAPDPTTGAVSVPIYQTSTYVQEAVGKHKGYEYARTQNPTRSALEENLAVLEGGAGARAFASGMAAITAISTFVKAGDHVVCSNMTYGGTYRYYTTIPTLRLCDIAKLSEFAHEKGAIVVVDNTFCSPYLQRPLDLGADIVMHSTTKFLNGHSDSIGGVVISNSDEIA